MFNVINNLFKNQLYSISIFVKNFALAFILFVIAHYVSVYDYGLFTSYKNIAVFCLLFANLSFGDYILVSSKANIKKTRLKITLFLFNALLIALVACIGCTFLNLESAILFRLVFIKVLFDDVLAALLLPYFQASNKFHIITLINFIYAAALVIAALVSYVFKLPVSQFLLLNIVLGCSIFLVCTNIAQIRYSLFLRHAIRFFKMLDKSVFAYIATAIAYLLYAQIPSLYVSIFQPREHAALYFAALGPAGVILILINAQTQKMIPEMINAGKDRVKVILKQNLIFMMSLFVLGFIFTILLGKFFLQLLYGQIYYTNAYTILLILMLGNIAIALSDIFGAYITASGNQKKKFPIQIQASIFTVLGLIIFYKYGIYGAAISYLTAGIYLAVRYIFTAKKLIKAL